MNILGYIIYGVGTLVILAFLWSAVKRQQKESNEEQESSFDQAEQPSEETVETETFTQAQTAEPVLNNEMYDNGPEIDIPLKAEMPTQVEEPVVATLEREVAASTVDMEPSYHEPEITFTPDAEQFKPTQTNSSPSAPSFTIEKKPAPPSAEHATGGGQIIEDTPTHIIAINVVARRGQAFYGSDILDSFERHNLIFTERCIYQGTDRYAQTLFSVASALEPGTFDLNFMDKYTTPGLTFFVDLNQTSTPKAAFKKMLTCAYEVAKDLSGDLLDHRRQRLTESSVVEYLAQIKGIESARVAS